MQITIDSHILEIYKNIVDDYAIHDEHCSYHLSDFCDCGLTAKKYELKKLINQIKKK